MITQQRSARLQSVARWPVSMDRRSVANDEPGRLIPALLALYLIPALLVVLAVGGLGMLILGVGRLFIRPVHTSCG
jgi:hypothetical protein